MFTIIITNSAQKDLRSVPTKDRQRISEAIDTIALDPFAGKKMDGKGQGRYSVRVWPFRIIYSIEKKILLVTVVMIGQRQSIYKRLQR